MPRGLSNNELPNKLELIDANALDMKLMEEAWKQADKSDCRKMHFGAVITHEKEVLATGYNHQLIPSNCCEIRDSIPSGTQVEYCTAIHAEEDALFNWGFKNFHKREVFSGQPTVMYVGGKYHPTGKVLSNLIFYCTRCSRLIHESPLAGVIIYAEENGQGTLLYKPKDSILRESFQYRNDRPVFLTSEKGFEVRERILKFE